MAESIILLNAAFHVQLDIIRKTSPACDLSDFVLREGISNQNSMIAPLLLETTYTLTTWICHIDTASEDTTHRSPVSRLSFDFYQCPPSFPFATPTSNGGVSHISFDTKRH